MILKPCEVSIVIDPLRDTVLTFSEAAKKLPRLRSGRPLHATTLWRWATAGLRGVKLETVQVGGVRVTSAKALPRFFAQLSCDCEQNKSETADGKPGGPASS